MNHHCFFLIEFIITLCLHFEIKNETEPYLSSTGNTAMIESLIINEDETAKRRTKKKFIHRNQYHKKTILYKHFSSWTIQISCYILSSRSKTTTMITIVVTTKLIIRGTVLPTSYSNYRIASKLCGATSPKLFRKIGSSYFAAWSLLFSF